MSESFREFLASGGPFQGYAYAYPHKTAYRPLDPHQPLSRVWQDEDKSALFLYAHVPFCEMRCGFCNLFTMTHPGADLVGAYLDALQRQAEVVRTALGDTARFARLALGGGTPTFLSVLELERLFGIINANFLTADVLLPKAIEASPATVDPEKIAFLKAERITRVSLGVQSFLDAEIRALGRAQRAHDVRHALGLLASANFACLNIDLIYGIAGQTASSWRRSLDESLEFAPQEIYLYPLYVRPLTHLDQTGAVPSDDRLDLYRIGRDFLLLHGYQQISMRLFRKQSYRPPEGPVYCCQEDGMVGIGPGARSYAKALHYSTEYAVGRTGILDVIADFNRRSRDEFSSADYGLILDTHEQKRRYLIKSLLRCDGLDLAEYRKYFSSEALIDLPQLTELLDDEFASVAKDRLCLGPTGLELSDVIGPWLWSPAVRERMDGYALK
jgi:oxygen-independent coproporphyrinogen-3 oxidase